MQVDDVIEILGRGEGQQVEFKQSFAGEKEAIKSLGAFANANGGTVILGADDVGNVVGVDVGKNTIKNFADLITANTAPSLAPAIEKFEIDGRTVVAVSIEKIGVGQVAYAFNRVLIRVGDTNQAMSQDLQRKRLLEDRDTKAEERVRQQHMVRQRQTSAFYDELVKIRNSASLSVCQIGGGAFDMPRELDVVGGGGDVGSFYVRRNFSKLLLRFKKGSVLEEGETHYRTPTQWSWKVKQLSQLSADIEELRIAWANLINEKPELLAVLRTTVKAITYEQESWARFWRIDSEKEQAFQDTRERMNAMALPSADSEPPQTPLLPDEFFINAVGLGKQLLRLIAGVTHAVADGDSRLNEGWETDMDESPLVAYPTFRGDWPEIAFRSRRK